MDITVVLRQLWEGRARTALPTTIFLHCQLLGSADCARRQKTKSHFALQCFPLKSHPVDQNKILAFISKAQTCTKRPKFSSRVLRLVGTVERISNQGVGEGEGEMTARGLR
jgi:hypothetical protein